jgi:2-polyprenyl-3-methyl-5-hydroxy-6-metoxy-1,4-benzoquinol methylase
MLAILKGNVGFDDPETWVDYGIAHTFTPVPALRLASCPDCDSVERALVGQYVYYSSLMRLWWCAGCTLIYSDVRLDETIIRAHFATAYKDDEYFLKRRRVVFDQIAALVEQAVRPGGSVLDVGGAKGHLLALLKRRRPDLAVTLNDVSREACEYARAQYGFEVVRGDLAQLGALDQRYDCVIASDVLYYEPRLRECWKVIPRLLRPSGTVLLRVPNKLVLMRLCQWAWRLAHTPHALARQDRLPFFNPEHIYVLSQSYLVHRLQQIGFRSVRALASPPLCPDYLPTLCATSFRVAAFLNRLSWYRVCLTPSIVVLADGFTGGRSDG